MHGSGAGLVRGTALYEVVNGRFKEMTREDRRRFFLNHSAYGGTVRGAGTQRIFCLIFFWGHISYKLLENCTWPNLDAMSVPEALVYSILHHFAQGIRIKHP